MLHVGWLLLWLNHSRHCAIRPLHSLSKPLAVYSRILLESMSMSLSEHRLVGCLFVAKGQQLLSAGTWCAIQSQLLVYGYTMPGCAAAFLAH